jgi:hypothetical protein
MWSEYDISGASGGDDAATNTVKPGIPGGDRVSSAYRGKQIDG